MPWGPSDASRFTNRARSPTRKRQWAHVAQNMMARGASEGAAIRAANGVVRDTKARKGRRIRRGKRK